MRDLLRSEPYRVLRDHLVWARRRARLTQRALAARIGRHQPYISEVETGQRRLDIIEFTHLVRALGLDPAEVMRVLARGKHGRHCPPSPLAARAVVAGTASSFRRNPEARTSR